MAGSPAWKVYSPDNRSEAKPGAQVYQAACKEPEAAAALVAFYGDGATIRYQHGQIVWREGSESIPANESYDIVAETIVARANERGRTRYNALYNANAAVGGSERFD